MSFDQNARRRRAQLIPHGPKPSGSARLSARRSVAACRGPGPRASGAAVSSCGASIGGAGSSTTWYSTHRAHQRDGEQADERRLAREVGPQSKAELHDHPVPRRVHQLVDHVEAERDVSEVHDRANGQQRRQACRRRSPASTPAARTARRPARPSRRSSVSDGRRASTGCRRSRRGEEQRRDTGAAPGPVARLQLANGGTHQGARGELHDDPRQPAPRRVEQAGRHQQQRPAEATRRPPETIKPRALVARAIRKMTSTSAPNMR